MDHMKKCLVIMAVIGLIIFMLGFSKCSSTGDSRPGQADETTGEAVDIAPIPANSEFLEDEPE
jgi:hypothetical protein